MTERRSIGKRLGLVVVFSLIGLIVTFGNLGGNFRWTDFLHINWSPLVWSLVIMIGIWAAKAYRMDQLTRGMGKRVGFGKLFIIYLATCFTAHVTPFNAGGTPVQVYLLHKQGLSTGKATAVTAVDLGLHSIVYFALIITAIWINLNELHRMWPGKIEWWTFLGSAGVLFLIFLVGIILWKSRAWRRIKWIRKLFVYLVHKGWLNHLVREWKRFWDSCMFLIYKHPFCLVRAFVATIVYWLGYLLLAPMIMLALGRSVSFWHLMGRQLVFNIAQLLIPTPGGSGGSELALALLFKSYVGAARIGIFVLLWRIETYFSTLVIGGFYFFKLLRNPSKSKETIDPGK